MRVLLDECLPRPLVSELASHECTTVGEQGWAGKSNGELMVLIAEAGFDVFLTIDQNLTYQQNLSEATVAVVILSAHGNTLRHLTPLLPRLRSALENVTPGEVIRIAVNK